MSVSVRSDELEPAAASDPLSSCRLRVSRWLAIESLDSREVVLVHTATSARLKVSRALYEFLQRFRQPLAVAEALGRQPDDRVLRHVRTLFERGFLVDSSIPDAARQRRRSMAVSHTLFHCPARQRGTPHADVSVLGLPYDLTTSGSFGSREAPTAIRRRSFDFEYQIDFASGRPKGWFDVARDARILEGVTFCDWGDVVVEPGEDQADFFARAAGLVREIVDGGSMPLLLGGDHSVAYPVVQELLKDRRLAVLYLDAHTDFDPGVSPRFVSAACVGRRIWQLDGVERVVQVGHRGYTINPKVALAPAGIAVVTVECIRSKGAAVLLDALPSDLPVYISLDLNVIDPAFAPGVTRPTPGGFNLDETKAILHAVGQARSIAGIDLVEHDPGHDLGPISAIVACHLLLAALGAAWSTRG